MDIFNMKTGVSSVLGYLHHLISHIGQNHLRLADQNMKVDRFMFTYAILKNPMVIKTARFLHQQQVLTAKISLMYIFGILGIIQF